MAKTRNCIVCNTEYEYCPHCGKHNPDEKWRFIYCSETCKDADAVIGEYRAQKIDAASAKAKLDDLGYDLEKGTDYSSKFISEIKDAAQVAQIKESVIETNNYFKKKKNKYQAPISFEKPEETVIDEVIVEEPIVNELLEETTIE